MVGLTDKQMAETMDQLRAVQKVANSDAQWAGHSVDSWADSWAARSVVSMGTQRAAMWAGAKAVESAGTRVGYWVEYLAASMVVATAGT